MWDFIWDVVVGSCKKHLKLLYDLTVEMYCFYISLQDAQLQFRGQRIWEAAMTELMSKGMRNAQQVKILFAFFILLVFVIHNLILLIVLQSLLSGCSAGGLASILHCDEFHTLFPSSTKVKCLSDAGLFMDAYFPNLETPHIFCFLLF